MGDATAIPESALAPLPAAAARCLRCSADLSRLPDWARYCPRCGLDTHQGPPAAILSHATTPERAEDRLMGWEHLRELTAPNTWSLGEAGEGGTPTSVILTGYSNAMYSLGRRYESGLGAAKNPREAARCYAKAARLGHFRALARLAVHYFAGENADNSCG